MAMKAHHALEAETAFVTCVKSIAPSCLDERQQKDIAARKMIEGCRDVVPLTPDILLVAPTRICGSVCHWIEYKNYFGFKSDPFLHKRNRAQFKRYVAAYSSGMVVYKLGFETGLLSIEGVCCFREAEVVHWLHESSPCDLVV